MRNLLSATATAALLAASSVAAQSGTDAEAEALAQELQKAIDSAEAAETAGGIDGTGAKSVSAPESGDAAAAGAGADAETGGQDVKAPTAEEIAAATFDGAPLPDGRSALTAKVQILLDRAGISPGVVDGWKGGMSESALRAFEAREGLPVDGLLDADVWAALGGDGAGALTTQYTITAEDFADLSDPLPEDYSKLAELEWLGYTTVQEKLAERFHMDEDYLRELNANSAFNEGDTITVVDPGDKRDGAVARIEIDKATQRLLAYGEDGAVLVNYPVTIGSDDTPSPHGTHTVTAIAPEPTYSYDPANFKQGDNDEFLTLPPGPNGPVGIVWIDLSKPTYGIHGTAEPSKLFSNASHGCVRLTNWDAQELMEMVSDGTTVVFQ